MKLKRRFVSLILIMVLSCSMNISSVMAYANSVTSSVSGISVTISNYISQDCQRASAGTSTGAPYTSASVVADFYYNNVYTHVSGHYHGSAENYGSASTGTSAQVNEYFYEVSSDHVASYNGSTFSYDNLITSIYGN